MKTKPIQIYINECWEKFLATSNTRELIELLTWCDEVCTSLLDKEVDEETIQYFLNSIPSMIITAKVRDEIDSKFCARLEDQNLIFAVSSEHISAMSQEQINVLLYYYSHKELASDSEFKKKMML